METKEILERVHNDLAGKGEGITLQTSTKLTYDELLTLFTTGELPDFGSVANEDAFRRYSALEVCGHWMEEYNDHLTQTLYLPPTAESNSADVVLVSDINCYEDGVLRVFQAMVALSDSVCAMSGEKDERIIFSVNDVWHK